MLDLQRIQDPSGGGAELPQYLNHCHLVANKLAADFEALTFGGGGLIRFGHSELPLGVGKLPGARNWLPRPGASFQVSFFRGRPGPRRAGWPASSLRLM